MIFDGSDRISELRGFVSVGLVLVAVAGLIKVGHVEYPVQLTVSADVVAED